MDEQTAFLRIQCGKIYILSNNIFSLVCEFCEQGFYSLADLSAHLSAHFPESDPINCNNDCQLQVVNIDSKENVIVNLQEDDTAESLSTEGPASSELNKACQSGRSDGDPPNRIRDHQSSGGNEYRNPNLLEKSTEKSGLMPIATNQTETNKEIAPNNIIESHNDGDLPNQIRERQLNCGNENRNTTEPKEVTNRSPNLLEKRTEKLCLMPIDTNQTETNKQMAPNNNIESHPVNVMENHENTHGKRSHDCHICFKSFPVSGLSRHILTHAQSVRNRLERLELITSKEQIDCLENSFRSQYAISNKTTKNNNNIK